MPDINIAHAGLAGAGSGAVTGAGIGTALGPIGTAIGAGVGAIVGFFGGRKKAKSAYEQLQASESAFAKVKETALTPIPDPGFAEFGRELRTEKRMVETGMTPEFQVAKDLIERSGASAASVAGRFSNPALAMSFLKQSQISTGANINKLLGTVGSQRSQYNAMNLNILGALNENKQLESQRALDVDLWEAIQSKADYTQTASDFTQNKNMLNMKALSELPGVIKDVAPLFSNLFGKLGTNTPAVPSVV